MKKHYMVLSLLITFLFVAQCAREQIPEQTVSVPAPVSPVVNADRTVTFSLLAPYADSVSVYISRYSEPIPMSLEENGIWTVTVGPLEPEIWDYSFVVDGVSMIDPGNVWLDERVRPRESMLEVRGAEPGFYSVQNVPHGVLSVHTFQSPVLGVPRTFRVYTPPAYDRAAQDTYPVFYLLHGGSNDDRGWIAMGRANYIFDNLIAEEKIIPMIVVMPDGNYRGEGIPADGYEQDLLKIIMPIVERDYQVKTDRENRAMAGLSMGAGHTLDIGIKHPELFSWIGAFSNGVADTYEGTHGQYVDQANNNLNLFWTAVGESDTLVMARYKTMTAMLDRHGVQYSSTIYPGAHTWDIWRKCIRDFTPLLFR